jgi:hypothetical protein
VSFLETYRGLGPAVRLDPPRAERIVQQAMPHALAALGRQSESLPVRATCVFAEQARGGSLIPAWPVFEPDGGVVIEYVADWGALLSAWLSIVDAPRQSLARRLIERGERVWIGVANDVLQLFVNGPPPGTYSMVRHHALMLAAATIWLGPPAIDAWRHAHFGVARAFLRWHEHEPLWDAIGAAEDGLTQLLSDEAVRQAAPAALEWLDASTAARTRYIDFLGAASLGVAAVLGALEASAEPSAQWLARAVAELHPRPEFNRDWIEALS